MSCSEYSLSASGDLLSFEDELFFSVGGCEANWLRTRVFASWVALFLLQLFIAVPFTIREWVFYGASQAAVVLIFICFNVLIFLLVELGFLFHIGLAWNVVVIGLAFYFLLFSAASVLYIWYRAVVSIHLIRAAVTKGELLKVLRRCFIVFTLGILVVLFLFWGIALISIYANRRTDIFNYLIAAGLGHLGFICFVIAVMHIFVGRKLINIFDVQILENPDQLIYKPDKIRFRVSFYCIGQATAFLCLGCSLVGIMVWGMVATSFDPASLGNFFYLYHFVLNIFVTAELSSVVAVIVTQERHITFTTHSQEALKTNTLTPKRESVSSSLSNIRRGSIEDSLIPGVGGTIAYHSRVFLPPIDESDPDAKLDTFLSTVSAQTAAPSSQEVVMKTSIFDLVNVGEERAIMRRPSRGDIMRTTAEKVEMVEKVEIL